jgi:hypothetical protein
MRDKALLRGRWHWWVRRFGCTDAIQKLALIAWVSLQRRFPTSFIREQFHRIMFCVVPTGAVYLPFWMLFPLVL